ncbi:hypothetical protein SLS58_001997 [Diplodia intermedia]|uniref:Nacht domain protein n=1 Tax=Diplodia intermedia TaxID=856260 RepID=A0ABR3U0G8_9PEZI
MSQSLHLSSRISPMGTAQLHSAIERFKRALDDDERRDFEYLNNQPDPATVLKFTAHLDEISAERQSRCIATRLQTVLQSVQQFSAVVETFVSSNPKVAALVWGSVKFALLLASNFGSYFEKLSALFMKFGRHCPRYAEYQSLYLDSTRLQSGLCSFYAALIGCCTRAVEVMKKPGWVQAARIITLSSFESDFTSYEQQLQHWSKEIKDEISAAAQRAEDRERRAQSEERDRAQVHRIWHRRRAKEQDLEMERVRSTYFFCRFDEEASLFATTILSSLLRQILRAETLSPAEQSSLEKILDPGPPEIEDLEYLLKGAVLNSGTLFIVVDALDECTESERYVLLKALKSIVELPGRTVKLFLSGRDGNDRHMRRMFRKIHFVSTGSPESKSDLREVVKKRLDELVAEEHLVVGHQSIFQEIEDHLLTKADGM